MQEPCLTPIPAVLPLVPINRFLISFRTELWLNHHIINAYANDSSSIYRIDRAHYFVFCVYSFPQLYI